MLIKRFSIASLLCLFTAFNVSAQVGTPLFGDGDQPGNRLHSNIIAKVEAGENKQQAISTAVVNSATDEDSTLNAESKSVVAFDMPIASQFFNEMVEENSLVAVTKTLIETSPEKPVQIITLGAVLYPDFAQEVFDGAALTGVMESEDILVAVLQAGVDPTTVSDAPAAGGALATSAGIVPLGAGIGAGGTGGGDTTASAN